MNHEVIERNLNLVSEITRFIFQNPSLLDNLPSDFQLVVLPEDDPELSLYNLKLMTSHQVDKPIVMVRLSSGQPDFIHNPPQLYVPLAA